MFRPVTLAVCFFVNALLFQCEGTAWAQESTLNCSVRNSVSWNRPVDFPSRGTQILNRLWPGSLRLTGGLPYIMTDWPDSTVMDSLWASDSVALTWVLADILKSDWFFPISLASSALAEYERHHGPAGPLLTGPVVLTQRTPFVIEAVRPPLTHSERDVIFAYACIAWRVSRAFAGDSILAGIPVEQLPLRRAAEVVLEEAAELLTGDQSRVVNGWLGQRHERPR